MTKIVAFAGKKQAGKSTAGNFLFGLEMWSIVDSETKEPLISEFRVDEKGRLIIPVDFGGEKGVQPGIFNPTSREPAVRAFLNEFVWNTVKIYSFADILKEVCITLLGLTDEQCYGSNEQKNTPSKLLWENMPGLPTGKKAFDKIRELGFELKDTWSPSEPMTAREVMQYVGTEVFRKMFSNVWVEATIKRIIADAPGIAIITDCRFPNEIEGIKNAGGSVIRLTRAPFAGGDEHYSEIALDDWTEYDAVIDNANMTVQEQNEELFKVLVSLDIIHPEMEEAQV